jgi:hypothetical protein
MSLMSRVYLCFQHPTPKTTPPSTSTTPSTTTPKYYYYYYYYYSNSAGAGGGAGGTGVGWILFGTGIGWVMGGKVHAGRKEQKLQLKHKKEQKELYTQYYNDVYTLQQQNAELVEALEQLGVRVTR